VADDHKIYLELCRAANLEKRAAADALISAWPSWSPMFAAGRTLAWLIYRNLSLKFGSAVAIVQAILTMRLELGLPPEWVKHVDVGDNCFESFTPERMRQIALQMVAERDASAASAGRAC
jgi:hypothetical protein